jgi:hypothetical protein
VSQESAGIAREDTTEDFKAYPYWVFVFLKRNNLTVRFSTIVGQNLPSDWEAKVSKLRLFLRENLFGVDSCHFGNMDEVPVSFDLPCSRTVNLKAAKEVSVATTGHDRSNVTVVLCITADGSKLPPMVIFKRKMFRKVAIPKMLLTLQMRKVG